MKLHRLDRNIQNVSDFLVGFAINDELENLALPVGQLLGFVRDLSGSAPQTGDCIRPKLGRDIGLSTEHFSRRFVQFLSCARLENVARGAQLQSLPKVSGVEVLTDKDQLGGRKDLFDFSSRFEAIQYRHADVEDDEIGTKFLRRFDQSFAVRCQSDNVILHAQSFANSIAYQRMVVPNQHAYFHVPHWVQEYYAFLILAICGEGGVMHNAESVPQPAAKGVDPLERRSFFWSMVGLGMLVWVSLTGAWTLRQVTQSDYWVDHTNEVLRYNEHILNGIREAESAERGYIITGDERYLAPYQTAQRDLPDSITKLQHLVQDNPTETAKLNELQSLISERLGVLDGALNQRRSGGFEAAQKIVLSGQGLTAMQKVHEVNGQIEKEELRLLQERTQARQVRLRNGFIAVVVALVLALVALLIAPFDVRRAVRQRNVATGAQAESESTAHALFETAAQGIFIVNQEGRVVMANPSSATMLGYEPGELIGQSIEMLVPERFRGAHPGYRKGYFHDPQNRPMGIGRDLAARRKDGSEFPAEISLSYIRSAQAVLAVAFLTDISKRKADEHEINQQREDLRELTGRMMTAQDNERRRIARDLHDDLSQKLAFLAMDMGKLANKASPDFVAEVKPLQMRAADAAMSVRKISHQLHPSVLDDIGLEAALEQYCEEFESRTGISTEFTSKNVPDPLPKEVASSLYHIAQECLRNAAKHSKSETVAVELEFTDGALRLTVRDQGVGLRGDARKAERGIGMVAMKERAHLVNGKVSIQSETGEGTEVRVEVPVGA